MLYIHRQIETTLESVLNNFSTVVISGPRQAGKTTLLQRFLKDYTYVCFDNFKIIEEYVHDPLVFLTTYKNKVIFDEAQKAPGLLNHINRLLKSERSSHRKYILAATNPISLIKDISDPLSSRIEFLSLLPYQCLELPKSFREKAVFCGSYPDLINKKYQEANDWFSAYLETYLNFDVRLLGQIGDMHAFRKLIQMLAVDIGQVLNLSIYARELGVEVKTIKRWISLLEASYIVFLLPPYYENYGKRIVKSPKVYFYDTGLVTFLTESAYKVDFVNNPMADALFENYIVIETLKKELHHNSKAKLFYLRTNHGVEINLMVERKKYKELIIIENAEIFNYKKLRLLENFTGNRDKGYLLYRGEKFPASEIKIIDYRDYLLEKDII